MCFHKSSVSFRCVSCCLSCSKVQDESVVGAFHLSQISGLLEVELGGKLEEPHTQEGDGGVGGVRRDGL